MIERCPKLLPKGALAFVTSICAFGLSPYVRVQTPATGAKSPQYKSDSKSSAARLTYEDDQIRVSIPPDWKVVRLEHTERPYDALRDKYPAINGQYIPANGGGLAITKQGYLLTVLPVSGQVSGIRGGRFIEVFSIPWLGSTDDEQTCMGENLREYPQPVNRDLIFVNLIFVARYGPDRESWRTCRMGSLLKERPWFGGYFTTAEGDYIFRSNGVDCADKTYTLTGPAKVPADLPNADDPSLQKIIGEAIDIVASIHYKRCPPARFPDSH